MKFLSYIPEVFLNISSRGIKGGLLLLFVFLMSLQSCTDDLNPSEGILPSVETGIMLYLPDIEGAAEFGATRTDNPTSAATRAEGLNEAAIKDMYLFIFKENGTYEKTINLKEGDFASKTPSFEGYTPYTIPLKEGTYKFYLLANLNEYITVNDLNTVQGIEEAVLNFKGKVPGTLKPENLPMACLASQMKLSATDKEGSAETVTIVAGKSNEVYADLYFLCSKVRYTILFDNSENGFSKAFTSSDVDFSEDVTASSVCEKTPIVSTYDIEDQSYSDESLSGFQLSKAAYPTGDNDGYINRTSDGKIPDNLGEGTWNETAKQRAWQGTVYLPENLDKENQTVLHFAATGPNVKSEYNLNLYWDHAKEDSEEAHGLERSHFYDIVIKLVKPGETQLEDQDIEVYVEDWTRKELTYSLHGPYELIVDQTNLDLVKSGYWTTLPFTSNVPDEQIKFDSPTISIDGQKEPLYTIEIVKHGDLDDDGMPYEFKPGWSLMKITVNPDIPYSVMRALNSGNRIYIDEKDSEGTEYKLENLDYFHIVAGNLHKKIDIETVTVGAYLIVTPRKITIDAREYYTSGIQSVVKGESLLDEKEFLKISFKTNFDPKKDEGILLTVTDDDKDLFKGRDSFSNGNVSGYSIQLRKCDGIAEAETSPGSHIYNIDTSSGDLYIDMRGLLGGSPYWKSKHEYNLTFTLTFLDDEGREPMERPVQIIVKPFSDNYVIRFRDNTKSWEHPHIYIYQLLTLPTDLTMYEPETNEYKAEKDSHKLHKYAGALVGYVEDNETMGPQYNGAIRYVFTNNLSFNGWWRYGGPRENNPWDPTVDIDKGFVMFGNKENECKYPDKHTDRGSHFQWNFDYSYTEKAPDMKFVRYNFDVNFNEDHEGLNGTNVDRWSCEKCKALYKRADRSYNFNNNKNGEGDNSIPHTRFYPGVAMEEDPEYPGWWKYTLTGVAETGRAVIFFANWHEPWEAEGKNYAAEDNRFPGDYEAATPLFDFADNEGWFQFNGNSGDRNQFFYDEKEYIPDPRIENKFTSSMTSNLVVDIKNKNNVHKINSVEVGYQNKWHKQCGFTTSEVTDTEFHKIDLGVSLNNNQVTITNATGLAGYRNLVVRVNFDDNKNYEYVLAPKNFKKSGNGYLTNEPLYLEFEENIPLYVKWSDKIDVDENWDPHYSYYRPGEGTDEIVMMKGNQGTDIQKYTKTGEEVGTYKHVEIDTPSGVRGLDGLTFMLKNNNEKSPFYGYLHVSELPIYYNPYTLTNKYPKGYYLINWHYLTYPRGHSNGRPKQCTKPECQ